MKKILLFIFTFFSFYCFLGQGNNLQFSQVLNNDYSLLCGNQYALYSAGSFTVPTNKVWKITYSTVYNSTNPSYSGALLIDNIRVNSGRITPSTSNNQTGGILWLKSGNYTVYLMSTSDNNQEIKGTISGIEFNIVQ